MAKKIPYSKKRKSPNTRYNYETISDLTSQDVLYTTTSFDTQGDNTYIGKHRNHYDDYSDTYNQFFEKFNTLHENEKSNTYDDYTSSFLSDETQIQSKKIKHPRSRSEYLERRSLQKINHNHRSPVKYSNKFVEGDLYGRKKTKRASSPKKHREYDMKTESELNARMKSRSPRRRKINYDNSYEGLEEENDHKNYFEQSSSPSKMYKKYKRREESNEEGLKKKKDWSRSLQKENNYQVFAYEEPKQHTVFRNDKNIGKNTLLSPEKEITAHEYPMLGFKKIISKVKPSVSGEEVVYMPIITKSKTSQINDTKNIPKSTLTSSQLKNIHVYAADVQNQQNIFQTSRNVPNKEIQDKSNLRNIISKKRTIDVTPEESLKYANSILGSIFNNSNNVPKENMLNKTNKNQKESSFGSKDFFSYQVNVDVVQSNKNVLGKTVSKEENIKTTDESEYKTFEDTLHDDYPVTKDYIKVNDTSTLGSQRGSMATQHVHSEGQRKSTIRKSGVADSNLIEDEKRSNSIAGKPTKAKSIIKRDASLVLNKDRPSEEKSKSLTKKMTIDNKQPSKLTLNDIDTDTDKGSIGKTSQNQELKDIANYLEEFKRKSTLAGIPKDGNTERRSNVNSPEGLMISKETTAKEMSEIQNRQSFQPKRPSQTKSLRKSSTILKSKPSIITSSVVEKKPTLSEERKSHVLSTGNNENQAQHTHLDSMPEIKHEALTTVGLATNKIKTDSHDIVKQATMHNNNGILEPTKKSFPRVNEDSEKHPDVTGRGSALNSAEMLNIKSKLEKKEGPVSSIRDDEQRKDQNINNEPHQTSNMLPLSEVGKEVENIYQISESAPKIQETIFTHEEHPQVHDKSLTKDHFIEEEQVTSVVDLVDSELHESKSKSKRKRSFRNVASALINVGRKPSSVSHKPYIQVRRESTLGELVDSNKERGDNQSPFIQSVEPISTLYKNKNVSRTETVKSTKSEDKHNKSIVKPTTKKSETKLKSVTGRKSKLSKKPSRSNTSLKDNESDNEKKNKSRHRSKVKSQKSIWGILRRSKSKPQSNPITENTIEASIYEDPPPLMEPSERFDQKNLQDDTRKEEKLVEKKVETKVEQSCKCLSEYIKHLRDCGHFFLGTTLHIEIMNILTLF